MAAAAAAATTTTSIAKAIYGPAGEIGRDVTAAIRALGWPLHIGITCPDKRSKPRNLLMHDLVAAEKEKKEEEEEDDKNAQGLLRVWYCGRVFEVWAELSEWQSDLHLPDDADAKAPAERAAPAPQRLEVEMEGGLSNQIYCFIHAAWLARSLGRVLSLPKWFSRQRATQSVSELGKSRGCAIREEYLVPFTNLWDISTFAREASKHRGFEWSEYEFLFGTSRRVRPRRPNYLSAANVKSLMPPGVADGGGGSGGSGPERLVLYPGLFGFERPSHADYEFYMGLICALRPAPNLQRVVTALTAALASAAAAAGAASKKIVWAVHVRLEVDWPADRRLDLQTIADAINSSTPAAALIYICGDVSDAHMAELRSRCSSSSPLRRLVRKQDLLDSASFGEAAFHMQRKIGFEEWAVIDRAVALWCDGFLGLLHSTFSTVLALQYDYERPRRPYALYPRGGTLDAVCHHPESWMFPNNQPLGTLLREEMQKTIPSSPSLPRRRDRCCGIIGCW